MRLLGAAVPLALLSLASANLAADTFGWASSLVSGGGAGNDNDYARIAASKAGEVVIQDSWSWADCGLPTDAIQLQSITVSPDPPVPGKNLTVNVEATVQDKIEDGSYADVVVKLGLIKLLSKRFDVCEEARNANATVQCPVKPGQYSVSQTVELPKEIPKAKFSVAVRGYTADDDDMVCVDLFIDFMKRP